MRHLQSVSGLIMQQPDKYISARRFPVARCRQGAALVYLTVMMSLLFMLSSLAVDLGRAEVCKTQLQAVADACARLAAQDLVNNTSNSTATSDAIALAAKNSVNGATMTLLSSDIQFGTWNTSTNAFTSNPSNPTAVKVTAGLYQTRGTGVPCLFASAMGCSQINATATSIAYVTRGTAPFNAQGNVTFNQTGLVGGGGTWETDSYVGNAGSYNASSPNLNGNVLTHGSVVYNQTTPVGGGQGGIGSPNMLTDVVGGWIYSSNGANCVDNWTVPNGNYAVEYGGWDNPGPSTQQLTAAQDVTFTVPTMPSQNTNPSISPSYLSGSYSNGLQDLTISDGSTVTLPGGTYTLNSLTLTNGSTLQFSGPVTLNIATNMTINAAALEGSSVDPKYMKINLCNTGTAGSNTVTVTQPTQNIYADLDAPNANFNLTQTNNGNTFYGRIFCNNLNCTGSGNGGMHGDESLSVVFHIVQ
jgi:Flp pilus assembly protein TadG